MASKGGLVRIVGIPDDLADRIEERRLGEPVRVTDRGVHYARPVARAPAWTIAVGTGTCSSRRNPSA